MTTIEVRGASEHNLRDLDISIDRGQITVITGVSGSGKSSLAFDTVLAEAQRRFFYTLSHYSRQFLDLSNRPQVRSVTGLSPAIALAQNETLPSRRATVGTLTDTGELLGVLLARFGSQFCPTHGLPTAALTREEIAQHLLSTQNGATLALCVPVAEAKKGTFKPQLTAFAAKGYLKAYIDGELKSLSPVPSLAREEKHTIKLMIDYVKIRPESQARLLRSIDTTLYEGQGFGEWFAVAEDGSLKLDTGGVFSIKGGCPECGFAWPRLDPRYFSANSLGRCESCSGLATIVPGAEQEDSEKGDDSDDDTTASLEATACTACAGTGLNARMNGIRLADLTPHALLTMPLTRLRGAITGLLSGKHGENPAFRRVAEELSSILQRQVDVGLGYLTLSRRIRSLSGGESQRLKLAGILAGSLRGVLYVLDEPSQGLHPTEIDTLLATLRRLQAAGNTILIVDHDEAVMRGADWIIDLGPGGGVAGGRIMAKFRPQDATKFARVSETARHLAAKMEPIAKDRGPTSKGSSSTPKDKQNFIEIEGATLHNLQIPKVRFPKGALSVVTGVSGAGKSSLVLGTLYTNAARAVAAKGTKTTWLHCDRVTGLEGLSQVFLVDRKKIAKSSVSMPGSYLDVMGELRDIFAAQTDAQVLGLKARDFSLSVEGGRCPECKGKGEISLAMRFLADSRVVCPACKGKRFRANILGVKYLSLSIADVLSLTLSEVVETFKNHPKIVSRLSPAVELGLGYLKLGQPTASLSGGEAQRLKLVPHLFKGTGGQRLGEGTLLILDEPTTGLHFEDVGKLSRVLHLLTERKVTVVAIEHNQDIIQSADWTIQIGPGAADLGGRLLSQG